MKHHERMLVVFEQVKLNNNENYIKQLYQLTKERFDREYLDFINEFLLVSNQIRIPISIYRGEDVKIVKHPKSSKDYWLTNNALDYDGADPEGFLPYFTRGGNQVDLPF